MFETKNVDNDKIEMFIESLIRSNTELFPENFDACTESRKKDFEITMYAIKKIMIELVERQKIDLSNVEYIASGCYSNVFRVGEFVVKIGQPRENRGVPYSKYIIQPLLSYKMMMGISIEVQNLVETKWYETLTEEEIEEELFKLYVNLRKDGIIWKDIKKENVGRLLKKNSSNFNIEYIKKDGKIIEEELNVSDKMIEVVGREDGEGETLPAGELVVIDRDYLVGRGAWTPKNPTPDMGHKFNKRYEDLMR